MPSEETIPTDDNERAPFTLTDTERRDIARMLRDVAGFYDVHATTCARWDYFTHFVEQYTRQAERARAYADRFEA